MLELTGEDRRRALRRALKWELLSGLFGWAWLLGSAFFVVAVGCALFKVWPWSYALYALGGSLVSKWIARAAIDNKRRVLIEETLMLNGMTKEQASQAWLTQYQKGQL